MRCQICDLSPCLFDFTQPHSTSLNTTRPVHALLTPHTLTLPLATPLSSQCTNSPVTTRDLTTAFGWTSQEAFLQQDVQVRAFPSLFPSSLNSSLSLSPSFSLFLTHQLSTIFDNYSLIIIDSPACSCIADHMQEMMRVLLDKLEEKMKDTAVEGTIGSLFAGEKQRKNEL